MSQSTPEKTVTENMPIRKKSIVWQYFIATNYPNKLKCINCNKLCSFKKNSTGNLIRHLRLRHPTQYALYALKSKNKNQLNSQVISQDETYAETLNAIDEIIKLSKNSTDPVDTNTKEIQCEKSAEIPEQSTSKSVDENVNHQAVAYYLMEQIDVNRAKEIDNQILKMLVKEFYPFSLVENQEFKSFVSILNSNYALPNCSSLSEELLSQTYQSTVEQLKSILKEIQYIALTIDRWTSIDDETFIAVTAHYLNKDLTLQNSLLDCISFHKDSSINISICLQELVGNWGVSEKIVAVVTENDPIIVKVIKQCQWQHISCFAYTLNKIIITCLAKINDVITKVRNIVDYFKRNPNAMAELQAYQNEKDITNIKFKKDTPSRWNSTFEMITSFLKHKAILKSELINLPNTLCFNDWLVLEKAVKLLVVFNTITVELCSEEVVSFSKVPYMIRFMIKHVTNTMENTTLPIKIKDMGEELKEELSKQSKIIESNDIICQSVLLDPRLKKRGFSENSFKAAYTSLIENVISLKNEKVHKTWTAAQSDMQGNTKHEYYIDVWSQFREIEKPPERDFTSDATAETDAFLGEAYTSMKDNPMTYWGNEINQNKFPILFELVKSRLCVPASSVPCKNIFSKAGNALIERRNFLPSNILREVLFLHHNL